MTCAQVVAEWCGGARRQLAWVVTQQDGGAGVEVREQWGSDDGAEPGSCRRPAR